MRVLLTGAAGFVGHAAIQVVGQEHWLRCVDVVPMAKPANGESAVADLASYAAAAAAVEGTDAIIHLAITGKPGAYESPEEPMRSTVVATANLLEATRRASIRRFVLMSSGAVVVDYARDTFIHAGLPHKFRGLYNLTKSLQEIIGRQYAEEHGIAVVALRPWGIVDGRAYCTKQGEPLCASDMYFGLICRFDVAEACRLALTAPLDGFQVFHLMATEQGRRTFDVDRTERLLGWRPKVDFTEFAPPR